MARNASQSHGHGRAIAAILALVLLLSSRVVLATTLPIEPVLQQSPVWCWAAVAEMAFKHNHIPGINPAGNYQCGIVGGLGGQCAANCGLCQIPAGQMRNFVAVMTGYPALVQQLLGRPIRQIGVSAVNAPLSFEDIVGEIDASRPVVAAISPNGGGGSNPEHVALVVGYEVGDGVQTVVVNDPFPFERMFPTSNPYLRAGGRLRESGQYAISYASFVTNLQWRQSVYHIGGAARASGTGRGGGRPGAGRADRAGDSCEFARDGVCDEPGACSPGTDRTDCGGGSRAQGGDTCRYALDRQCDEPVNCAPGTDMTDCASTSLRSGANRCKYARDGACDEPELCDPGTDTADCSVRRSRTAPQPPPPPAPAQAFCCDGYGIPRCNTMASWPNGALCGCPGLPGYGAVCR